MNELINVNKSEKTKKVYIDSLTEGDVFFRSHESFTEALESHSFFMKTDETAHNRSRCTSLSSGVNIYFEDGIEVIRVKFSANLEKITNE